MKGYHAGFDYFTPDAGQTHFMHCRACGEDMVAEKNVKQRQHGRFENCKDKDCDHPVRTVDIFKCRFSGEDWHNQVISLRRFQRDTPSRVLSDLVEGEILQIIQNRMPTKQNWGP